MRKAHPKLSELDGFRRKAEAVYRRCDHPDCDLPGEHRAPKDRSLSDYWWFCLDHVRDYNKTWNYYAGMTEPEIELHLRNDTCWQRPTWPLGTLAARMAEAARQGKAHDPFNLFEDEPAGTNPNPHLRQFAPDSPEAKAMRVMELDEPLDKDLLKARYRVLVKRYHPDAAKNDKAAEERFKQVSDAYRTLMKSLEADEAAA